MIYLYTIHVKSSIEPVKTMELSLFYKVSDFKSNEHRRQKRVKSIVDEVLKRYHYLHISDNNSDFYITGPVTIKDKDIQSILENGIEKWESMDSKLKRLLISLQRTIFYDPFTNRYDYKEFGFLDITPLNLLRETPFLHVYYLDPKQELHKQILVEQVQRMFFYPYMSTKMNINVLSLISKEHTYLDSVKMVLDICKKPEDKIVFLISEDTTLSFIMELTDIITRDSRVSLYQQIKYKRSFYKIYRDGDRTLYTRELY